MVDIDKRPQFILICQSRKSVALCLPTRTKFHWYGDHTWPYNVILASVSKFISSLSILNILVVKCKIQTSTGLAKQKLRFFWGAKLRNMKCKMQNTDVLYSLAWNMMNECTHPNTKTNDPFLSMSECGPSSLRSFKNYLSWQFSVDPKYRFLIFFLALSQSLFHLFR